LDFLEKTYLLVPKDVFAGTKALYLSAAYVHNEGGREEVLSTPLLSLAEAMYNEFVDLTITFAKDQESEILQGTPSVRVFLS
jgi:hypothetical protein